MWSFDKKKYDNFPFYFKTQQQRAEEKTRKKYTRNEIKSLGEGSWIRPSKCLKHFQISCLFSLRVEMNRTQKFGNTMTSFR